MCLDIWGSVGVGKSWPENAEGGIWKCNVWNWL